MQAENNNFLPVPYDGGMKTGRPATSQRTDFGTRLHALREASGLSQQEVAKQLGISQPSYALWERRTTAIPVNQLTRLAEILGVRIDELFVVTSHSNGTQRKGGPTGKARRVFEEVSRLPRTRQQRILATVEDMLTAQRVAANA
jgi:transcriptional regulator with XRE-family HTH domain